MSLSLTRSHRIRNGAQALLLLGGLGVLLGAVGWFVAGTGGAAAILLVGGAFLLASPRLSPRLILRMYGARPLEAAEAPELFRIVGALAERAGPGAAPRLFYIPSAAMNAFSVGRRGEAAIALTDGLLRNLSRRELTGVLAHEIAHVQANDIWIMGIADSMGRLVWLGSLFGQVLLLVNLPLWFAGGHTLPWWPIVLLMAAPSLSALLQLGLSRAREFDADVSAAELTGDPEGLALSLDKLERAQHGWFERIFLPRGRQSQPSLLRTHPATEERIERLLALDQARRRGDEEEIPTPPEWRIGLLPDGWPVITRRPSRHWHGMWW